MHFVPQYFLAPRCPIKVTLIGAGGNGSQMLSALARIDHALRALGNKGLSVTVWDPDTVEAPNVGRQLFTAGDLGQNKAECLVTRFNRLFGNDWKAVPEKFKAGCDLGNIVITCVDNVACRQEVGRAFRAKNISAKDIEKYRKTRGGAAFNEYNEHYPHYWLDLGNAQKTGQAILGSNRVPQPESKEYETVEYLPTVTEMFDLSKIKEKDSGPSCSMAEALSKQDLFINSVLVQTASSLLWSVLTDMAIDTRGFYVNLETYRTTPVQVKADDIRLTPGRRDRKVEKHTYEIRMTSPDGQQETTVEAVPDATFEKAWKRFVKAVKDYVTENPDLYEDYESVDDAVESGMVKDEYIWDSGLDAATFRLMQTDEHK